MKGYFSRLIRQTGIEYGNTRPRIALTKEHYFKSSISTAESSASFGHTDEFRLINPPQNQTKPEKTKSLAKSSQSLPSNPLKVDGSQYQTQNLETDPVSNLVAGDQHPKSPGEPEILHEKKSEPFSPNGNDSQINSSETEKITVSESISEHPSNRVAIAGNPSKKVDQSTEFFQSAEEGLGKETPPDNSGISEIHLETSSSPLPFSEDLLHSKPVGTEQETNHEKMAGVLKAVRKWMREPEADTLIMKRQNPEESTLDHAPVDVTKKINRELSAVGPEGKKATDGQHLQLDSNQISVSIGAINLSVEEPSSKRGIREEPAKRVEVRSPKNRISRRLSRHYLKI